MKLYAREIDDGFKTNTEYLERWQTNYGSILSKLSTYACINCGKLFKHKNYLFYVACHNGEIIAWHQRCKTPCFPHK